MTASLLSQRSRQEDIALLRTGTILAACKTLIEIISPPKRDRQMTAAIEIQESVDISEYIRYGDKDREDTLKRIEAGWPGSIWIGDGPNLPPSLRWIVKIGANIKLDHALKLRQ